jgi:hypothetical protein
VTAPAQNHDAFGQAVTATAESSVDAWRRAYDSMLRFTGDPIATVAEANATDERFVMGPIFVATYMLLGGADPAGDGVGVELVRIDDRAPHATPRERAHADALRALYAGEFLDAAQRWDAITRDDPDDFTAYRCAHDVCLHIGDDTVRLPSAQRAAAAWEPGSRPAGLADSMLAFAFEEVGRYEDAAVAGSRALAVDSTDLWARHALTHVYESRSQHDELIALLEPTSHVWGRQDLLANHLWWHLAVRLLNHGAIASALELADEHLRSRTAFGLCDSTSLLWRLHLAGGDVGDRWTAQADGWAAVDAQWHTCGFLDLHAAIAFAAQPRHPAAPRFWDGLGRHAAGAPATYNGETFRNTVAALTSGFKALGDGDTSGAIAALTGALPPLHRIGGSVIQRDIVHRTIASLEPA